jgi:two-component system, OmpR family, sensor histidine kinase KdpD
MRSLCARPTALPSPPIRRALNQALRAYHQNVRVSPSIRIGYRRLAVPRPTWPGTALVALLALASLGITTLVVAALETAVGIDDASPVYLVAVVAVGAIAGTLPAVVTGIAAFLVYDLLFTEPRLSLVVADNREWLDLVLFLFIALVIGRLVSIQHARADEAAERADEANTLFAISRSLAITASTADAAPEIAERVRAAAGLERLWIVAGPTSAEHTIADTGQGPPPATPSITLNLVRTPGDEPARWVRTHVGDRRRGPASTDDPQYRVRIEADSAALGTLVGTRSRADGNPSRVQTRVLSLAADQIASSLRRDQLRQTATELEVARQTDSLKTALIDSVSHDLRTPLASIRATAGGLADPDVPWPDDAGRSAARVIDSEAARLDRLVSGVLDLSRIASGAIHPDLEPHELWAVVEPSVERLRPSLAARPLTMSISETLPPVLADAVLLDIVITNLLDNVIAHTRDDAPVMITAEANRDATVTLTVEDGGEGVAPEQIGLLFERFRRASPQPEGSRRGLGIGLSVVRGLVEAMGGRVAAAPAATGGLASSVTLRQAPAEPDR